MKTRVTEAEIQIKTEADDIRKQGNAGAEDIKTEGSLRIDNAVSHIISKIVGD
jgi:vacuolar-type H+-ATPase subunit H